MIDGHRAGSLGRRLSRWLAWQSLLGLTLVSAVVFAVSSAALESRQGSLLEQKQAQVRHLLVDAGPAQDAASLTHRLDDYLMGHPDLALTLRAADGSVVYERPLPPAVVEGRVRRFVSEAVAGPGPVEGVLRLDTEADRDLLAVIGLTLVASTLAGAGLVSAGGYLLVRMGLRPVQQLIEQTRTLTASTLHRKLDGRSQPSELAPLVDQFNRLLDRLDQSYEQLESFNADVAHELATPLSTLIVSSENALRKSRDAEALREVLGANLEDLQRMAGIVRDMLFLSQADRGALARRTPVESLAGVARPIVDFHESTAGEAGLSLAIRGDAAGLLDVALLQRALSNLLGNALRFARPASTVEVRILQHGEWIELAVFNEGAIIAPEHLPRLFDRFYREDQARTEADQHHGLGLAIVAAIARMHGGRTAASSDRHGTSIGLVIRRHAPGTTTADRLTLQPLEGFQ